MTASASAQGVGEVFGETSLRPMDITCVDLTSAGENERSNLVFFIAGYKAAMEGDSGLGAATPTTTGSAPDASQLNTAASGSAESDLTTGGATGTDTAAAASTDYDATSGSASTTLETDTAAAGSAGSDTTSGGASTSTETETAAAASTDLSSDAASGGAFTGSETDSAAGSDLATGGASGTEVAGAASATTGVDTSGATDAAGSFGGDVMVSRSFFGMSVDEILQRCQDDPTLSAIDVIGGAQSEVQ
jgi:hypothetical protein